MRVRETGLSTYPNVTVVCGPWERDPDDGQAVTNPTLIVEVLSPSTEQYDRGDKLEHYKRLPSLRQYVLVAHDARSVEVHTRADGDWSTQVAGEGEVAELSEIGCSLDVRELYDAAAEPTG